MDNIPVSVNNHGQRSAGSNGAPRTPRGRKFHPRRIAVSFFAVVILAVIVVAGLSFARQNAGPSIDKSKYQAVFLSSGQVYFGKLEQSTGEYLRLTDVFYLQTKTDTESENPQAATTDDTNVELIKLGNEIHGPQDEMIISRDQVLFFENLKSDGRVSQSIANYRKQ